MKLDQLCRDTYVRANIPKLNYLKEYARLDQTIRNAISEFDGVKTDLFYDFSAHAEQDLRVSLTLSDFTSIFPVGGNNPKLLTFERETAHSPKGFTVTREFEQKLEQLEGQYVLQPGYLYRNDSDAQELIRQVNSLAQSGRIMIRPLSIVLNLQRKLTPDRRRNWKVIPVEPNMPGDTWFVRQKGDVQDSIPLRDGAYNPELETNMGSFIVPYIEGISLEQLAEILAAEGDSLAEFRKQVREVIALIRKEPSRSNEIVHDTVRAATDRVERKFKAATNIQRIKLAGGAVSGAALVLSSLTTAGVTAAIAAILGAGGFGFAANAYADYLRDRDTLRDMPFYLLWRLKRGRRE